MGVATFASSVPVGLGFILGVAHSLGFDAGDLVIETSWV